MLLSEKRLSDYSSDYLFLQSDTMNSKLEQDAKYQKSILKQQSAIINIFNTLLALLATFAALLQDGKLLPFSLIDWGVAAIGAAEVVFFILNIKSLMDENRELRSLDIHPNDHRNSAFAQVVEAAKNATEYTAVLIIAKKEENTPIKLLCRKNDYFLFHSELDKDATPLQAIESIRRKIKVACNLQDSEIREIEPLEDEPIFTVKMISGIPKSVALFLYTVKLNESARSKINAVDGEWHTIDEMKNNPKAMQSNFDVIAKLDDTRDLLSDSFCANAASLHVIWNITARCNYDCKICATSDRERKELDLAGKLDVLNHLARERERIKTIDFAGGDPCVSEESLRIVQAAIGIFGKEKVSVTTTAAGIKYAEQVHFEMPSKCEITYDASHQNLNAPDGMGLYRKKEYNKNNETIPYWPLSIRELTVNIPILDCDLTDAEIDCLVRRILDLQKNNRNLTIHTNLLRLMPVGGYAKLLRENDQELEKYRAYDPLPTASKIQKALEDKNIPCTLHCSLRVLDAKSNSESHCTMLENKIGIDCAGNVFACAWAGYLCKGDQLETNPFFLGNLNTQTWQELTNTNNATPHYKRIASQITNKQQIHYCQAVSCFFEPETWSAKNDPLYQKRISANGK